MKKELFIIFLGVCLTKPVWAQQAEPEGPGVGERAAEAAGNAAEAGRETARKMDREMDLARERRALGRGLVMVDYSLIDLLIPGKKGLTAGLIRGADKTWEFEYLQGSLAVPFLVEDLGEMSDERFTLMARSYAGSNSFNFSYGLSYLKFSIHLGNELLSRVSGGSFPSIDLLEIETLGFHLGLGNRWTFKKNITFGIDWVSWTQPVNLLKREAPYLDYASDSEDRDSVETALNLITYFPRLTLLKAQLGIQF